jgi:hypothetical protein
VAKLVDALVLGTSGAIHGSSSLPPGTNIWDMFVRDSKVAGTAVPRRGREIFQQKNTCDRVSPRHHGYPLLGLDISVGVCYTTHMKNIYNKSIVYGLGTLAILVFGVALAPNIVSAGHIGYNYTFSTANGPHISNPPRDPVPEPTPAPAPAPGPADNTPPADTNTGGNTGNGSNSGSDDSVKGLASNALFGSDGIGFGSFMPSGLIQWILFAIMVLLIVILVRKIFGADLRYHASPMKHD